MLNARGSRTRPTGSGELSPEQRSRLERTLAEPDPEEEEAEKAGFMHF